MNEEGETDPRCLVCGYYNEEKENWWNEGCELQEINAVGAVCACTHLTVFSALLNALIKALMCSNLDLLASVEQWKFGPEVTQLNIGSAGTDRLLSAEASDFSTAVALRSEHRRLENDCKPSLFEDLRAKVLSMSLSAEAPCVPKDEKKPVEYTFTVTPNRCAMPGIVLGYSLLIAFVGIVKSRIAVPRHDFWFASQNAVL